ncbi:hypothetical protein [Limnoglobus roseus]|uniref:Uncharacterized protein n=1 Tax=Limnoglobus roseus TaxID=2598579 RepID=A0A5C1AKH1_9BACT|nr:hypothetical protein [Limnoglobus roseus]QEL17654.1 hypothetical protein PX52LOC_04652 [Limnoglobus roseus]
MPHPLIPHVRDRLVRLTDALVQLKARVREAVATEMGRIVAECVNDVLAAAVRGRPTPVPPSNRAHRPRPAGRWAAPDDPVDPDAGDGDCGVTPVDRPAAAGPPAARPWPAAVSAGVLAAKWLWQRRLPWWPCLGGGLAAGLAALTGHPAVVAALGAVAAAVDLAPAPLD